jgi:hypothetical protein
MHEDEYFVYNNRRIVSTSGRMALKIKLKNESDFIKIVQMLAKKTIFKHYDGTRYTYSVIEMSNAVPIIYQLTTDYQLEASTGLKLNEESVAVDVILEVDDIVDESKLL